MYYSNKYLEDADAKRQQQNINCHFIVTLNNLIALSVLQKT